MSDELFNIFLGLGDLPVERREIIKAPLAFPGSKADSLSEILPELHITKNSTWVDVFGGTGIVSLNVPDCKMMVYNDRHSGLIDFYRAVRDNYTQFLTLIQEFHPWSREEWTRAADTWAETTDPIIRGALWYYMVRVSIGQMGISFARQMNGPLNRVESGIKQMLYVKQKFAKFLIENLDGEVCLKDFDAPHTIFYVDPPYLGDGNPYRQGWSEQKLQSLLYTIGNLQGRVVFSHRPSALIDSMSYWSYKRQWDVKVRSGVRDYERDNATEVIWIKESVNG